ncbi:MAG: type II toxin-antitoxin system Phd/YefM family antitoxin [Proteobacteria bacterium]|nr:type II toxin-antitoxin system Phd/YefM family antitoxin [Pseudomonadota bacterium]
MINITEDIHSLTEFKKNTNDFITDLKRTKRPSILTVNGKAELVVMDAASYQKIQEHLGYEETLLEINQSLRDFDSGKFSSATEVFSDLKHRIDKSKNVKAKKLL